VKKEDKEVEGKPRGQQEDTKAKRGAKRSKGYYRRANEG